MFWPSSVHKIILNVNFDYEERRKHMAVWFEVQHVSSSHQIMWPSEKKKRVQAKLHWIMDWVWFHSIGLIGQHSIAGKRKLRFESSISAIHFFGSVIVTSSIPQSWRVQTVWGCYAVRTPGSYHQQSFSVISLKSSNSQLSTTSLQNYLEYY